MKIDFTSVIIIPLYVLFLDIRYSGEVMITQVSGFNVSGVTKDPRRKAQSIQFKRHSNIPYKSGYDEEFERQQRNALWTSISIVVGSVLFVVGYFLLSGKKRAM